MKTNPLFTPILCALLVAAGQAPAQTDRPPLKAGDPVPDVKLQVEDGSAINLRDLVSEKPTVVIFYRGGWCVYCNRHLQSLAGIEKEVQAAGAQMLAISMDRPEKVRATPQRGKLGYRLFSDSAAAAAKAFGIAFKVEDALVQKYKNDYKIDLEAASGRSHHLLPYPAVFVCDQARTIRFAHVNPDYKVRLAPEKILQALRDSMPK